MDIKSIEERLTYHFRDPALLKKALTHTSYANEKGMHKGESNERLEFLGDAVLNTITCVLLMERFPDFNEGELSKFRSRVVGEESLARLGRMLCLGEAILLGRGEEKGGGRRKNSILASTFEAVVAALYLDSGFDKTFDKIGGLLKETIDEIWLKGSYLDYKTLLQEISQRLFRKQPVYRLLSEDGPEHSKVFEVEVAINGVVYGSGRGGSKKEAEKEAAQQAYDKLSEDRKGV